MAPAGAGLALRLILPLCAARRLELPFADREAFLEGILGQEAEITGLWRVDRIEIERIEILPAR
jgi:hypothetical protein